MAEQFRRWYSEGARHVEAPSDLEHREFAFLPFGGRTMFRHISFDEESQLRRYLSENAPAHAYHSIAYYRAPRAEMSEKGWQGADLVFDIDADHFDLPCQREHDRWRCRTCGMRGVGKPPELCEGCGKATFETETWLCEGCLRAAKYETQKLLDILIQDFGLSPSTDLIVNFSGNRGYHVHARGPKVRGLSQQSRREVVDYMMGTGIDPQYHGFSPRVRGGNPVIAEGGWRGRLGKALYDYLTEASEESITGLKLGRSSTKNLLEERDAILRLLVESHPSSISRYIDPKSLGMLTEAVVERQAADIDTVVTTDVHRLIRLSNTLHGKTGWLAQRVPLDKLADYDPLESSVAFRGGTEKLHVRWAPRFRIGEDWYGPYEEEDVEVPMAAAIFMLCKKGARVSR